MIRILIALSVALFAHGQASAEMAKAQRIIRIIPYADNRRGIDFKFDLPDFETLSFPLNQAPVTPGIMRDNLPVGREAHRYGVRGCAAYQGGFP